MQKDCPMCLELMLLMKSFRLLTNLKLGNNNCSKNLVDYPNKPNDLVVKTPVREILSIIL